MGRVLACPDDDGSLRHDRLDCRLLVAQRPVAGLLAVRAQHSVRRAVVLLPTPKAASACLAAAGLAGSVELIPMESLGFRPAAKVGKAWRQRVGRAAHGEVCECPHDLHLQVQPVVLEVVNPAHRCSSPAFSSAKERQLSLADFPTTRADSPTKEWGGEQITTCRWPCGGW